MLAAKDLPKMTNAQLQVELKKRGLAENGKKVELVERLSEAIRKEEDAILNADASSAVLAEDDSLADAEALLDDENPSDTATTEAATENKPAIDASQKKTEKNIQEETQDAKVKRAQRFGLPIGVASAGNPSDPKQKRAERFGLASPTADDGKATSDDAKAKRAARFGIPVSSESEKVVIDSGDAKAKRAARFGTNNEPIENKDKLMARAQRFGIPVSGDGKRTADVSEFDAKKKARAERFGMA